MEIPIVVFVVEPELFIYGTSAGINKNPQLKRGDKFKCVNTLNALIDIVAHVYHRISEIMKIAINMMDLLFMMKE